MHLCQITCWNEYSANIVHTGVSGGVCGGKGVCGGGVCVWGLCLYWHSKRGQEYIFYMTKRGQNFSPRFVTRCTVLTLSIYGYGGAMDVNLSLYVPGMFRDV